MEKAGPNRSVDFHYGRNPGSIAKGRLGRGLSQVLAEPARDPKIRLWNPLGFKIIDFKSEPEVTLEQPAEKETHHDS